MLLGNGDGTFQAQQPTPSASVRHSVAVADVNGDGKPDLVVANSGDNTVERAAGQRRRDVPGPADLRRRQQPRLGRGGGCQRRRQARPGRRQLRRQQRQRAAGQRRRHVPAAADLRRRREPASVAVADFNGDGQPDLVVANYGDSTVSVLLGNGDGTFQGQRTYAVASDPSSVTVADLAMATETLSSLTAAIRRSAYCSAMATGRSSHSGRSRLAMLQLRSPGGHQQGDGRPDLIVTNGIDNTVSVLLGTGDGTFQPQQTFTVGEWPELWSRWRMFS